MTPANAAFPTLRIMPDDGKLQPLFLLSDEPIGSYLQDDLEMDTFRDVITGTVLGTVGPFTIGVYGRWGEGKTSLLRAAESRLRDQVTEATKSPSTKPGEPEFPYVVPVWFNPWQYEAEEHQLVPLVAEIERAVATALMDEESITKTYGKATVRILKGIGLAGLSLLRSASAKASINTGLPGLVKGEVEIGISGKDLAEGLESAWDRAQKDQKKQWQSLVDQSTYLTIFDRLKSIYAELDATRPGAEKRIPRIAVFIDDLDRCQADKAFELIEAVKLVLGQRGFIFILALDKGIVDAYVEGLWRDRLKDRYGQEAARYLDKIVQLPLYLRKHENSFEPFVNGLLGKMDKGGVDKDTLAVFKEVTGHLGKATEYGPRALVRRINTLLVDQKLRPGVRESDPQEIKDLTPAQFLGLCLVQRTLLDYLDHGAVISIARADKFCNSMAEQWQQASKQEATDISDPVGAMYAFLDKLRENAAAGPAVFNPTGGISRESKPDSPEHVASRQFLVKLDPYNACKYVLSTDHGERWLGSRVLRDLVTDFVSQRPIEQAPQQSATSASAGPSVPLRSAPFADTAELREQIALIERAVRKELDLPANAPLGPAEFGRVTELMLHSFLITDAGAAWLADPARGLIALTELWLSYSKITDAGVRALASEYSGLRALTSLDLAGTRVTDAGAAALAAKDSRLRALTYLDLSNTKITDAGVAALAAPAAPDSGLRALTSLQLRVTRITDAGAALLAAPDSGLPALTELDLDATHITDAGVAALAAPESGLRALNVLVLSGPQITDAGAKTLAAPDSGLRALTTLHLFSTHITDEGVEAIQARYPGIKIIEQ